MRLHVHRTGDRFLEVLKASRACYYAAFARSRISPAVLREAMSIARTRGHRNLLDLPELRARAEAMLRDFFETAARSDPEWRYAFSSRVPLAIPDYPDVALIFLLRALNEAQAENDVHTLIPDGNQASLARYAVYGGQPPVFKTTLIRGWARAVRSFTRSLLAAPPRRIHDAVIVTLGDAVASGGPDAYFGDFAAALARHCGVLTVYAAPGARLRFPSQKDTAPLEAFLHATDMPRVWSESRRPRFPVNDAPTPLDAALIAYLRGREHASGEVAMQQVMTRAFERLFACVRPKTVLYPFENRSWEKNLLRVARRSGVARCIGYQHSSLTARHLAFSAAAHLSALDNLPDLILTCGEVTAERIKVQLPQVRMLVKVGAALRAKRLSVSPPHDAGVLAPISSSRAEAWEILSAVAVLAERLDAPIIVRSHPTIVIDDLYAQFTWPAHVQLSRGTSLAEDFERTAFVVYSSSTVALEGMLYGRLPIYLAIGDIPSGNPIEGEHEFIFRAQHREALSEVIARIRSLPPDVLQGLRDRARDYAERYLIEPTPERVEKMAKLIAQC